MPYWGWILLGLGSLIALVFAHKGFHGHRSGTGGDEALAASRPETARLFGGAWGIDALYQRAIVKPVGVLAFLIAVVVDQFAIDGMVNGAGNLARRSGTSLRRFADGSIASYGLWMGGVTAGIAFLWIWMGAQ